MTEEETELAIFALNELAAKNRRAATSRTRSGPENKTARERLRAAAGRAEALARKLRVNS